MSTASIISIILAVLVIIAIGLYNKLVRLRNRAEEAWADIDVQLKRRHDLIPNIVEAVKGYAAHEARVFQNVTDARARVQDARAGKDMKALQGAENALAGTLKTLFAVAENYPELKANANFLDLQRELADTENKLQAARRFYNTVVRDLNTAIESFPYNTFAGAFHFAKREYFEIGNEAEKNVPEVSFDKNI